MVFSTRNILYVLKFINKTNFRILRSLPFSPSLTQRSSLYSKYVPLVIRLIYKFSDCSYMIFISSYGKNRLLNVWSFLFFAGFSRILTCTAKLFPTCYPELQLYSTCLFHEGTNSIVSIFLLIPKCSRPLCTIDSSVPWPLGALLIYSFVKSQENWARRS